MQVKKFEAKSMKEALELVKVHLGPEAIILSARDSHRGFGLMGEKSVEVTAAVSDETLRKKKIAEARLREDLRQKFHQIPATKQKEYINKVYNNKVVASERRETVAAGANEPIAPELRARLKGMKYAEIVDDETPDRHPAVPARGRPSPNARVSAAAAAAYDAARGTLASPAHVSPPAIATGPTSPSVEALESQVRELRAIVERFQKVPQIPLSMHPGAEQGLRFELSGIFQRLTNQGVRAQLATGLLRPAEKELDAEAMKKTALVDAWVIRQLLDRIETSSQPATGRYHVFVGPAGQGKTTALVKFASKLMLKEKRTVAIVSLDTFKLGAADQLRLYAQILNVPFAVVRDPAEWQVAEKKLAQVQHILVDAPGLSLHGQDEIHWLRAILPPAQSDRMVHLVQSILAREEEADEIAARYQAIGFNDLIFTRLDESSRHGMILNFQDRFKVPVHSFSVGNRIPEDYEFATKERVVDLMFKLSRFVRRES